MDSLASLATFTLTNTEKYMLQREFEETKTRAVIMHEKKQRELLNEVYKEYKIPELAVIDVERFDTDFG